MNYLSFFCLKVFIFALLLKNNNFRWLVFHFNTQDSLFFFSTHTTLHSFLTCMVCDKKHAVYNSSYPTSQLSLIFCSFSMLYLKVGFFLLILSFWICGFLSFNRFGKLSACVSSNIASIPFFLSSHSEELTDWASPKLK